MKDMNPQVEPMGDLDQRPQHIRTPGRKPGNNKKMWLIIGIAVGILLVGAGVFWFLQKDKKSDSTSQSQSQQQQSTEETDEPTMAPADAAQLETYKSTTLNIEIAHRKDWTLKEDAEKKLITLTSPKFTFQTANESKKDVFTLKFGMGASKEAQKNISSAKAVRDSLLIAYDAPTESQRYYTNISYLGPAEENSSLFSFFIVSGSIALKADNPVAGSIVINSGDFLIAGGFGADAQNQLSFTQVPATELEQYSAYEQAVAIVKSLKVY